MGETKQTFMEARAKVEMTQKYYNSLSKEIKDNMELKSVHYPEFPFEEDEEWRELKKQTSSKNYFKLKDHESKLIQKYKDENNIND